MDTLILWYQQFLAVFINIPFVGTLLWTGLGALLCGYAMRLFPAEERRKPLGMYEVFGFLSILFAFIDAPNGFIFLAGTIAVWWYGLYLMVAVAEMRRVPFKEFLKLTYPRFMPKPAEKKK